MKKINNVGRDFQTREAHARAESAGIRNDRDNLTRDSQLRCCDVNQFRAFSRSSTVVRTNRALLSDYFKRRVASRPVAGDSYWHSERRAPSYESPCLLCGESSAVGTLGSGQIEKGPEGDPGDSSYKYDGTERGLERQEGGPYLGQDERIVFTDVCASICVVPLNLLFR